MAASINPEDIAALLRECARKHILPYHGALEDHHKSFKGGNPQNEVTIADHESEAFLTRELMKIMPGSEVVGEEAAEDRPEILEIIKDPGKAVWVIDPIDGTSNFARGSSTYCVMVALLINGETQMGWIYDVSNDSMAFAQKGKGAYINGQHLDLRNGKTQDNPTGYAGYRYAQKFSHITVRTLRCAGHEYLKVAQGHAEFNLYAEMKPWDHLAGALLVKEAGGCVRKWDGSPYRPGDMSGGLIAARNAKTWQGIRDLIPQNVLKKHGIEP